MKIINDPSKFDSTLSPPLVLTIGNFDGLHLGHQTLLYTAKEKGGNLIALTFANHPLEVLNPTSVPKKLYSLDEKMTLFSRFDVDVALVLHFNQTIAKQTAFTFLSTLRHSIPFTHLVLGSNAVLGHDRIHGQKGFETLGKSLGFHYTEVPLLEAEGTPISSGRIRTLIHHQKQKEASTLLGRPYDLIE